MATENQVPVVFDNLIEAADFGNLGRQIPAAEPAEQFINANAKGNIAQMTRKQIGMRAKLFGQRFMAASRPIS